MRIKFLNKDYLRKNKKRALALVTVPVLAGTLLVSSLSFVNPAAVKTYLSLFYNIEKYSDFEPKELDGDGIYYSYGYTTEETQVLPFTYHPSDEYVVKVLPGLNESDYYRIEVCSDPIEYSEWLPIPEDGRIVISRKDFSDEQYSNKMKICFGKYNVETDEVVPDKFDYSSIFQSDNSLDLVELYENTKLEICNDFKSLINEDDSEFEKVKKAYDYIIDRMQYNHDPYPFGGIYTEFSDPFGRYWGDCTLYADVLSDALNGIGIECFKIIDDVQGHVWNIVRVDGKYYHLDATYSDIGSWSNTDRYRYFLVSDEFMYNDNRYFDSFTKEKDVECDINYDLTGIVSERNTGVRGLK